MEVSNILINSLFAHANEDKKLLIIINVLNWSAAILIIELQPSKVLLAFVSL